MRTSILKKVSLSSKIIFADRGEKLNRFIDGAAESIMIYFIILVDYATEFKNKQKEIGVLKAKVKKSSG